MFCTLIWNPYSPSEIQKKTADGFCTQKKLGARSHHGRNLGPSTTPVDEA